MVLALLLCFVGSSVGTSVYSPYPPRCPAVANPLYGYVKIVSSRCNYYCNSGYRLVGSSYRTCSYGSWKPDPPKCVPGIHTYIHSTNCPSNVDVSTSSVLGSLLLSQAQVAAVRLGVDKQLRLQGKLPMPSVLQVDRQFSPLVPKGRLESE